MFFSNMKAPLFYLRFGVLSGLLLISLWVGRMEPSWMAFWPSLVALVLVFVFRSALMGLLVGAIAGALVLSGGTVFGALAGLWKLQFLPIFGSSWKLSAMTFTLILGGFVALVEASGGLQTLVSKLLGLGRAPAKRMQFTAVGMGLLVFFDGLANTMMLGRLLRTAADRSGVSREKLAYLADATGSAVACLAFISTWIAFQLSMIETGFALSGRESGGAYALFFQSLPTNFYCWFTLILVFISIFREFNPGSMGSAERRSRNMSEDSTRIESSSGVHWIWAIVPILVLTASVPALAYWVGAESIWPISLRKFATAYAAAESMVPYIMVGSSLLAAFVAAIAYRLTRKHQAVTAVGPVFLRGVRELLGPVCILIAAWMLGTAIGALGAADQMAALIGAHLPLMLLPLAIFLLGAGVSFSTGTSWGTMGVLMPLAIPIVFSLTGELGQDEQHRFILAAIGAVFSGAVFGDHCSPFSDTTIVASIASGVEPMAHVRTQLPFAVIAALTAGLFGFWPYALGLPAWCCLLLGTGCMLGLSYLWPGEKKRPAD